MTHAIELKRVYEPADKADGARITRRRQGGKECGQGQVSRAQLNMKHSFLKFRHHHNLSGPV